MLPDATLHNPNPDYLRRLIRRIGWSQAKIAEELHVARRTIENYLKKNDKRRAPYWFQYSLEVMAAMQDSQRSTPEVVRPRKRAVSSARVGRFA